MFISTWLLYCLFGSPISDANTALDVLDTIVEKLDRPKVEKAPLLTPAQWFIGLLVVMVVVCLISTIVGSSHGYH